MASLRAHSWFVCLAGCLIWSCGTATPGSNAHGAATSSTSSTAAGSSSTATTGSGGATTGSDTTGASTGDTSTTTGASSSTTASTTGTDTSGAGGMGGAGGGGGLGGGGAGGMPGDGGTPPPMDPPSNRVKFNFNIGWKFIKQDVMGAQAPAFDDKAWIDVSTPHTYNDVDTYAHLGIADMDGEKEMWNGLTWYRKHFTVPAELMGRKIYIEFEGVRQRAHVYLNGVEVGKSEAGFIPFGFDLTSNVKFGADNVLAVSCDNTFPMNAEGSSDRITWHDSHWHPNFGGITRNVYLHVMDKVHVTLPLYTNLQTSGIYVHADNVSATSADITIEAQVANDDTAAKTVDISTQIVDAQGKTVLTLTDQQMLQPGKSVVSTKKGTLANPQLWEPAHPYLYRTLVTLKVGGTTLDVTSAPLGIRFWKFDLATGFSINGKHLKLHGWGQKPTNSWAGLGAATPEWMHEYTMRMEKAANSNFIRRAHCAGSPGNIQMSDKYGIIVLQPGVDAEGDANGAAWKVRSDAFRSMVTYFRNNPSILIYEGGNQAAKTSVPHITEIQMIAKTLDPGRTFAFRRETPALAQYFDISIGTEAGNDAPSLPVVEGEYGRWESPRRVWDKFSPPTFGYNIAAADMTPGYAKDTEDFAVAQVSDWATLKAPGHSGGANFHFTDEPTHRRVYIEVARNTGEVDAVRLPKEAYFAVKAMWSEQPQVHIIGHWNFTTTTTKDINVVSNCDTVELFVNGTSIGKNATPSDTYLFTFKGVKWAAGSIKAVGYKAGVNVVQQEKKTAGVATQIRLTATTGPDGLRADGADIAIIDVEVLDKDGNRVPTDQARVDFTLSGPGVWRGGYNSGIAASVSNTYLDTEAGINRVFVRTTSTPGTITVNATRMGLTSGSIKFDSLPVVNTGGLSRAMPAVYTTPP